MANIIVFPLVLRSPSQISLRAQRTPIVVFPLTTRAALIARAAQRWRSLSREDAGDYLEALLELVQDELPVGHVDQDLIDDQLIALARAIKAAARNSERQPSGDVA